MFIHFPAFNYSCILDESHEILPREHGSNTPSIIIHTCEDSKNLDEKDEARRQKLIRPTLVQTRRPPRSDTNEQV